MDHGMLRLHYALAITLLLASPVWGELLDPDGENNVSTWHDQGGTTCDSANCITDIVDADGDTAICDDSAAAGPTCILLDMETPSANPTTGADDQTVQGTASEHDDGDTTCVHNDGAGNPSITVEIYCGGTDCAVDAIAATAINGDGASFSGTFTFGTTIGSCTGGTACAADGSDLQFNVCSTRGGGTPSGRRWLAVEKFEWDASVSAGGRTRRMF
jgi:hypothetical protein